MIKRSRSEAISTKVQIDDKVFASIKDASVFLKINPEVLASVIRGSDGEACTVKGFKVKRIGKGIRRDRGCVYCKETNQLYESASALARQLNIGVSELNCTLKRGIYVDRENRHWIRISKLEAQELIANSKPEQKLALTNIPSEKSETNPWETANAQYIKARTSVQRLLDKLIQENKYNEARETLGVLENLDKIFNKTE